MPGLAPGTVHVEKKTSPWGFLGGLWLLPLASGVSSGDHPPPRPLLVTGPNGRQGLAPSFSFISVVTLVFLCQTGMSLVPWSGSRRAAPLQPLEQAGGGAGFVSTRGSAADGSGLSCDG